MEDGEEQHAVAQVGQNSEPEEEQTEPPVTEEAETAIPPQSSAPAQPKATHGPLLQAAHRDSVIVLCSGQRLFGQTPARGTTAAPAASTPDPSDNTQEPHDPSDPPVGARSWGVCQPSGSEIMAIHTKATLLCQKRVLELRKRLPILEDLILDEECATYMSQPQYCVALPRCSNPVASTLLLQESTCFVPVSLVCASPTSCSV